MVSRGGRRELVQLDVDGSGPLPAFPVTCLLTPEGQVSTGPYMVTCLLTPEGQVRTRGGGGEEGGEAVEEPARDPHRQYECCLFSCGRQVRTVYYWHLGRIGK